MFSKTAKMLARFSPCWQKHAKQEECTVAFAQLPHNDWQRTELQSTK
jgi:hypothetical protein